jgi:hypothetical protein
MTDPASMTIHGVYFTLFTLFKSAGYGVEWTRSAILLR